MNLSSLALISIVIILVLVLVLQNLSPFGLAMMISKRTKS